MNSKIFTLVLSTALLSACSSAVKQQTSETQEDKVLARIDDLSSRPSWLKESEPFKIINGEVISLGSTTIPSNNRVEAAQRIAQNNAKAGICTSIEQRLDFVLQNAEENTTAGSTQARYIGAEACKLTSSSIRPGKEYWEKVATTQDSGERVTQFKVFSTVVMPEQDFKNAVLDAIRKQQGKSGISADFAKKVDSHWDQFVNGKAGEQKNDQN